MDLHDTNAWGGLTASWQLAMEAERLSERTRDNYGYGPHQLREWLLARGDTDDVTTLTPATIREWLAHLAKIRSPETCRTRHGGLRAFLAWCVEEGELDTDPMANVPTPALVEKAPPVLKSEQLKALLDDCSGNDFTALRDRSLILLFADTGCRLSGIIGLRESDLDLRERTIRVRLKGGREAVLPFGAVTARTLDRYLRAKRRMPYYGDRDWLWLSSTNKGRFTGNGVQQMLRRRGQAVGVRIHPHMFRHNFVHTWLSAGGSEGDLMELVGWNSRQMLTRYARATRSERAREAHRRLSPMDNL